MRFSAVYRRSRTGDSGRRGGGESLLRVGRRFRLARCASWGVMGRCP